MLVKIIIKQTSKYLSKFDLTKKEINDIINHYLIGEITGKTTHGIRKLLFDSQFYNEREAGDIQIIKDNGSSTLVDCQKNLGPLSINEIIKKIVIPKTKKYGITITSAVNFQRFGSLYSFLQKIVEQDLIAIIVNSTESCVAQVGDTQALLGTNPIGIGIPFSECPIILDMSTSKASLNKILQAREDSVALEGDTFLDKEFKFTTDPFKAMYVLPFGGYKGCNLSLFIQILSSCFLDLDQFSNSKNRYDFGCTIICFKKNLFTENLDRRLKEFIPKFDRIAGQQAYKKLKNIPPEINLSQFVKKVLNL